VESQVILRLLEQTRADDYSTCSMRRSYVPLTIASSFLQCGERCAKIQLLVRIRLALVAERVGSRLLACSIDSALPRAVRRAAIRHRLHKADS
jgi:hypothetical protein